MYSPSGQSDQDEYQEIPELPDKVQTAVKTVFDLSKKYTEILVFTVQIDQIDSTIEFRLKLKR